MQYIEDMKNKFEEVKRIRAKYELPTEDIEKYLSEMGEFKVICPVLGNFSTGKSAMINAVLEKELLTVDITPETAVPTEIYAGDNQVFHYYGDKVTEYKIENLPLEGLNVRNTDFVRIEYDCPFLRQIPSVKLVDLPGFDTSIELHNKAIDQYLPNSLAYLLVVSSDEPVLKESITNFLKELKFMDVPVYVVITKAKRLSTEELKTCRELLKKNVGHILEKENVQCACIESIGDKDVSEVKNFLLEIQEDTEDIFNKKYYSILRRNAKYVEVYLLDRMDKKDLSTSELEHEKEKLEKDIQEIMNQISREMSAFEQQLDICISEVRKKIYEDMEDAINILSVLIRNGSDISDRVNSIVRNAVAVSVKAEFEPRLQNYLDKITETVHIESPIQGDFKLEIDKKFEDGLIHNILVKVAPFVLATLGAFVSGPLLAIIGVAVGAFSDVALNVTNERKKNREALRTAKQISQQVSEDASKEAELGMRKYVENVNDDIRRKVEKQKQVLEKSLNDVEKDLQLEEAAKAQEISNLEKDLQEVQKLMSIAD